MIQNQIKVPCRAFNSSLFQLSLNLPAVLFSFGQVNRQRCKNIQLNFAAPCELLLSLSDSAAVRFRWRRLRDECKRLPACLFWYFGWKLPLVPESISSVQQHRGQKQTAGEARPPAAVKSFCTGGELSRPHAELCLLLHHSCSPYFLLHHCTCLQPLLLPFCLNFFTSFLPCFHLSITSFYCFHFSILRAFLHQSNPIITHQFSSNRNSHSTNKIRPRGWCNTLDSMNSHSDHTNILLPTWWYYHYIPWWCSSDSVLHFHKVGRSTNLLKTPKPTICLFISQHYYQSVLELVQ